MRPEKTAPRDKDEAFTALGVAQEWVAPIRKAGCPTVAALGAVASPASSIRSSAASTRNTVWNSPHPPSTT